MCCGLVRTVGKDFTLRRQQLHFCASRPTTVECSVQLSPGATVAMRVKAFGFFISKAMRFVVEFPPACRCSFGRWREQILKRKQLFLILYIDLTFKLKQAVSQNIVKT